MVYICLSCNNKFESRSESAWQECPKCGGDSWWENSSYFTGSVFTPFFPSWGKYEKAMKTGDPHDQFDAAEKFSAEREHAIKTDPKADRWERSRKASLQKQKGAWLKEYKKKSKI